MSDWNAPFCQPPYTAVCRTCNRAVIQPFPCEGRLHDPGSHILVLFAVSQAKAAQRKAALAAGKDLNSALAGAGAQAGDKSKEQEDKDNKPAGIKVSEIGQIPQGPSNRKKC